MILWLGWLGSASYLLNHAAFSLAPVYPRRAYFAINLFAAVCLVISSAAIASWHPVANNGFWAVTSALALIGRGPISVRLRICVPAPRALAALAGLSIAGVLAYDPALAVEILGWASVLTYAAAYLAFAAGFLARERYLAANLAAALMQAPVLTLDQNWPVLALQAAWAGLSLAALLAGPRAREPELPPEADHRPKTDDDRP